MKGDGRCLIHLTVISADFVPGCVPGVVPACNLICGVSPQTYQTPSIVSSNPVWNHEMDFSVNMKKDGLLFILRDADQLLGSLQVPLRNVRSGTTIIRQVELTDKYKHQITSISFCLNFDQRSVRKKRLLASTKKFKETVFAKFGSDPALNVSDSDTRSDSGAGGARKCPRTLQRCHSYVNERNGSKLLRHSYVNSNKSSYSVRQKCSEADKSNTLESKAESKCKSLLVLIQGRNLGQSPADIVSVTIGGTDCTGGIERISSEQLLVRVPSDCPLSPVSVITRSGGVGQQNAKVKVTFDSPSALKNRRISPEGQSSAMSSPPCKHKPPTGRHMALSSSFTNSPGSTASMSGISDSGSDNMTVNTKTKFVAPPRTRALSVTSSRGSSVESECDSSSSVRSRSTPKVTHTIVPLDNSSLIAPPLSFSEGSSTNTTPVSTLKQRIIVPTDLDKAMDKASLQSLSQSELIEEVLRLRTECTDLHSTVDTLRDHFEKIFSEIYPVTKGRSYQSPQMT